MTFIFKKKLNSDLAIVPIRGDDSEFNEKMATFLVEKRYPGDEFEIIAILHDAQDTAFINISEQELIITSTK